MNRAVRKPLPAVPATAVLLFLSLLASAPAAYAAPPGKDRTRERDAVNLEEMVIRGDTDYPGVLYRLPRPETLPPSFTAGPDERMESLLRDTRDEDDGFPPDGLR